MKKNNNLLILSSFVGLAVLLVGFGLAHKKTASVSSNSVSTHRVMDVASGDTNNEVLKTIIANQQKLETQNKKLSEANKNLRSKRDRDVKNAVSVATNQLKSEINSTKTYLESQIHGSVEKSTYSSPNSQYDVGEQRASDTMITTVADLTDQSDAVSGTDHHYHHQNDDQLPSSKAQRANKHDISVIPYYTLPSNSTINNVYLMSAIIAEVPVSNKLLEPAFPFKAIIGKNDLMAANGAHLPDDISGAVISGYSVGNMTMSCSRSYVMQILFVFKDANSFTVYPEKVKSGATDLYPKDSLGYLSDPYGSPCISGKYLTNAPRVLSTYAGLGGISATGQALAQAQLSTLSNSFETTQNVSGNVGKYAAGSFLNGASQKSLEWYTQRVAGTFDAVYIPASTKDSSGVDLVTHLTLNLTQNIDINLDKTARKMINEDVNNKSVANQLD